MPAGALVMVPLPVPALLSVSAKVWATPVPLAIREMISPSAAKLTFAEAVADVVGVKRTVTATASANVSFAADGDIISRSEEHTSELQSHSDLVCRLLLENKK